MMVTIFTGAFKPDAISFILFLAICPPLIGAVALVFLNIVPYVEKAELEDEERYCSTGGLGACSRVGRLMHSRGQVLQ